MQRAALIGAFVGAFALAVCSVAAKAQDYPTKPVRIIVPYAPGGTIDTLTRTVAARLSKSLGQSVFIENRPGGAAQIGANSLAQAEPDGYTLGIIGTAHAAMSKDRKFQYTKELQPVAMVAVVKGLLCVNATVPANSLKELIALARSKPGQLTYGNAGNLSAGHLAMELFKSEAGIDIVAVPYKGGAPAMQDLLGGTINMTISGPFNSLQNIQDGKLRAIASTGATRSLAAPEVPTFSEAGLLGFELNEWYGIFAPAKTPKALVEKLNVEIRRALEDNEVSGTFKRMGSEPGQMSVGEFDQFFQSETVHLGNLVTKLGLPLE